MIQRDADGAPKYPARRSLPAPGVNVALEKYFAAVTLGPACYRGVEEVPMAVMYVDVEALNLRSGAASNTDNKIGSLFLMQRVDVLGDEADGWALVETTIDGAPIRGYVAKKFLRAPVTPNREALIASASREFMRFARGLGKENVDPFSRFVGEMWRAIGVDKLDGTDRGVPWSAAAISFMVRNAGNAYKHFKFAPSHSRFVHHAIQARMKNDKTAPFWGFRLDETRPQIGDIVARDNPEFAPVVTFDIASHLDSYRSHTDIVVHVDSAKRRLLAIGGNVGHSVGIAIYDLAPGDFLSGNQHTFALLRNRTDE